MIDVSIIICSFNYQDYIEPCLLSCLNQNHFKNFEVIAVDDGSTDETCRILRRYSKQIRLYEHENHGLEYELNFAIAIARGEFIVRVDADDKLDERYLSILHPKIKENDIAFIYPEYYTIDEAGVILDPMELPDFDPQEIRQRGDFLATGTLYRKKDILNIGSYNEEVKNCGLENYEVILKLLNAKKAGICIHDKLFFYRRHNNNLSVVRKNNIISHGNKLAKKFNLPQYQTNQYHPWGLTL